MTWGTSGPALSFPFCPALTSDTWDITSRPRLLVIQGCHCVLASITKPLTFSGKWVVTGVHFRKA